MMRGSAFCFVVCQVGAEAALKKEIARAYPQLKFSFSRPGFVTFKNTSVKGDEVPLSPDFSLDTVFGRAYGLSFGRVALKDVAQAAKNLIQELGSGQPVFLHVWQRDRYVPGDEPPEWDQWGGAEKLARALRQQAGETLFSAEEQPIPGQNVLDLALIEEDECWIGWHIHRAGAHSPWPGGRPRIEMPKEAPSRAYLKLEEVLRWAKCPLREGDVAVEVGSAPGGACYSLLKRGVSVIGIDPGDMDPRILAYRNGEPRFKHIKKTVATVPRESLPESIQWLLLDMNVAPHVSIVAIDRLASRMRETLLGVILTIKLNQWELADSIPELVERVKQMGMTRVRVAQLSLHRQEIVIVGLTRLGTTRKG